MSRLKTRSEQELQDTTLDALEITRINGAVAPVYLQIANDEAALQAYLQMEVALRVSGLTLKEIEAIKLVVSQHNQCNYCLSVHTVKSKTAGIGDAEQMAIRKAERLSDARLHAIVSTTWQLLQQPGTLPAPQLEALRAVGLEDKHMVSIALAISTITFTNLFNHFNDSKPPFAPAPPINTLN